MLKKLNELQQPQITTTETANATLKERLKNLRKAILKASQDKTGATLKYSLPCIEQLCKDHNCSEEYTRIVALLGGHTYRKAAREVRRVIACWMHGLESSSKRCIIKKKNTLLV